MYEIRLQSYRQIIKIQQRNTVLSRSLEGKFIRHISSRVPSIWILNRQNSNDDLIEFLGFPNSPLLLGRWRPVSSGILCPIISNHKLQAWIAKRNTEHVVSIQKAT